MSPKRKDTAVYFSFWSIILRAYPFLVHRRESDNQWVFALSGLTVDFDQAQLAGFAMAIGYQILLANGTLPPPSSASEAQLTEYNRLAKETGMPVALEAVRTCGYHYNQAVIREARKITDPRRRAEFERLCMKLKTIDLTIAQFDEIVARLANSFPGSVSWISFWTRTSLALSVFPCHRGSDLMAFLQRSTSISRTENLHSVYSEATEGHEAPCG